jgi:predicted nuclease of predicted toxin-antitoxin system
MRFKVDENLHPEVALILRDAGHDAQTVWDQEIVGVSDSQLAEVCRTEQRALITLDLDFADIRAYPPEEFSGWIVLRLARQDRSYVRPIVQRLVALLPAHPLARHLWIVDELGLRIRGPEVDDRAE